MSAFEVSRIAVRARFLDGTIFSSPFLRVVLIATGSLAAAPASAASFWTDEDPMVMRPVDPPAPPPQQHVRKLKHPAARLEKQAKENAKPVGPLVISISLQQQRLRVFDANGLFAETPVSTGIPGHPTPMGVFSVIQKNKFHKSNIYSGAPMPYMQRITWSGIALHAGVLPGHPASHGCIRMPMAFAVKMWGWTRMGARVIITPGEISPSDISHPLLASQKPAPTPTAATETKPGPITVDASKAVPDVKPTDPGLKPAADSALARTQTADASNSIAVPTNTFVASDAPAKVALPAAADAQAKPDAAVKPDDNKLMTRKDLDADVAKSVELPASDAKPTGTVAGANTADVATPEPPKVGAAQPGPAKADTAKSALPPIAEVAKPTADAGKDQARPSDSAAEAPKADTPAADAAPKRTGQIAVLVSGRDGKLYVRQNFAPLFETPISIKSDDRPLGTHVFTARVDKDEAHTIHWTAVSLPAAPRRAEENDNLTRRRKSAGVIEVKAQLQPDSATEALDRLNIPADAMAQINDALATGGSIVVTDLGIKAGGETGQGTEFVVPLR